MPRVEVRTAERTFSSQAGAMHWVPGSLLALRPFPSLWEIWDVSDQSPQLMGSLLLVGLIDGWDFTVINDWKRGELIIRLQHKRDLHQWSINPQSDCKKGLIIQLKRTCWPIEILWRTERDQKKFTLASKETFWLDQAEIKKCQKPQKKGRDFANSHHRILLGCHKAAHWSRIDQRCDLSELAPILSLAGQWAGKALKPLTMSQNLSADSAFKSAGLDKSDMQLPEAFERFWRAHFKCWAFPHWGDAERTGLEPIWRQAISPLYLYSLISKWLLNRLFTEANEELTFLPSLPAFCHAGRVENLRCRNGSCDFIWSKKRLKMITFRCAKSADLTLFFQKQSHCLRIRRVDRRRGAIYTLDQQSALKLHVQCGKTYQIDRLSGHR